MKEYLWINWSNLDYLNMPVRGSFRNVVGNFEFPVDRFNMLDNVLEIPCRNILQDPKFSLTNLTNDWEDRYYSVLDSIADNVFTIANGRTIVVTYSGGIDSVSALISLQKHSKYKEYLEQGKFKVALTSTSITEYPELFYKSILPNIPLIPLDYVSLMNDDDVMLVTGDMGDYCIGSSDTLRFSAMQPDLDLMAPWREIIPLISKVKGSALYLHTMETLASKAPFEICSINQLFWWTANSLTGVQDDLFRPWYWSTAAKIEDAITQNKIFRFFYDAAMMTFSFEYMSTNPVYHNYIDNKTWQKKYIVNSTNDISYMNKQKIFSQRLSLRHVFKTSIYIEDGIIKFGTAGDIIHGNS